MDWINSIQRSLNYIEDHLLDKTLNNDVIAKAVYSSSSNFQRIFSLITGGTIADYIRCRKLTIAGEELANTDAKIIDIAFKYGYDTPESFTKAFVRFHGITPAKVRNGFGSLRHFEPIVLRLTIEGGFTMNTKIISNITTIVNTDMGENYHFNGIARYIMQCLGETSLSDYSLFAGITGDNMVQFYPLTDWKADSASDYYLGLRGFVTIFNTIGYKAEAISEAELNADFERKISKIQFSIDRGIPVIWYHNGLKNVIVGYEQEGETLLYITYGTAEPERITLNKNFFECKQSQQNGFIIVESKERTVSLRQIYRKAILQLPKLLTLQTGGYWLQDVLLPNERKELIQKYGPETLETLGGALDCKLETLQNPEKCKAIAKQIRRFADCADEIVRILNENLIN